MRVACLDAQQWTEPVEEVGKASFVERASISRAMTAFSIRNARHGSIWRVAA